jgi:hypothetical protein
MIRQEATGSSLSILMTVFGDNRQPIAQMDLAGGGRVGKGCKEIP